jgi:cytochrome c
MTKKYQKITALLISTLTGINTFAEVLVGPQLGQAVTAEEIEQWDIGVMPDGEGLPQGQGTVAEGKIVYEQQCLACHGQGGMGESADQLAAAQMGLTSEYPEQTIGTYWPYATTLFDMIRRSMPMTKPGSLTNDQVYAITAYLLYLNNNIKETDVMNAATLPQVKMPNSNGFINVYELEKTSN